MTRGLRFILIASLATSISGCALSWRSPNIADLRRNPGRYQDQTVSINGVVTSSWGLPLVPFRFYKVDDGTGDVTVLSDGRRMPATGEHVRVRGRVEDVAVIGGRPLGLHLREDDVYIKR
ncbi:MAG TPA: hypothetical protein VKE51_10725 [Vicinamibacterales bacterium]|nr:hypothetical protein [Vicinamibacterales bacterium]